MKNVLQQKRQTKQAFCLRRQRRCKNASSLSTDANRWRELRRRASPGRGRALLPQPRELLPPGASSPPSFASSLWSFSLAAWRHGAVEAGARRLGREGAGSATGSSAGDRGPRPAGSSAVHARHSGSAGPRRRRAAPPRPEEGGVGGAPVEGGPRRASPADRAWRRRGPVPLSVPSFPGGRARAVESRGPQREGPAGTEEPPCPASNRRRASSAAGKGLLPRLPPRGIVGAQGAPGAAARRTRPPPRRRGGGCGGGCATPPAAGPSTAS